MSLKILLVDDNVDSCELFQLLLERMGHAVESAHTGNEGLAQLEAGEFDLAIIDIGLPVLDGLQVAARARETLGARTPRLVAMTGYVRSEDVEASRRAGFDEHLLKPVEPSLLASVVERAQTARG